MSIKTLHDYVALRRSLFDPKGDWDPISFEPSTADLARAASIMGPSSDITPLKGGSFNRLYRFDAPSGPYVLKIPVTEKLAHSLTVEQWAATEADKAGFPALVPTLIDTSHYLAPFSFSIAPFVEEDPKRGFGIPLDILHSIKVPGYGPIDPREPRGVHDTWTDYITTRLDDHIDLCITQGAMSAQEAYLAEEVIRGLKVTFEPSLLHNDLSGANVIAGFVLDWESVIAGDPLWDLASCAAFAATEPIEQGLSAYYGRNSRPVDWDRRFWTYYLRIALARTVHRARFKLPEHPAYPKASSRIQLALSRLA